MRKEILFREAFVRFLKTKADSSEHVDIERSYLKLFGIGEWKEKVYHWPQELMVHQVHQGLITDLTENRLSEGLKPSSVNYELRNVRRVLNYAINSMRAVPPVEPVKVKLLKAKPKTRFVRLHEERRILAHCQAKMAKGYRSWEIAHDLYLFLVDTGVRISEALSVRAKDVKLDDGLVEVWRTKTEEPGMPAITPRLREVIERRLKECNGPTDLLFKRTNRGIRYLRNIIHEVCNQDPIEVSRHGRATIHSLRDTFASRLVMKEVSLYTVSTLLGHTSLQMSRKYSHLEAKVKAKQAAEVLTEVVNSNSNEF